MTHKRIPADFDRRLEGLLKRRNFQDLAPQTRLYCRVCDFFYWRLWQDRAQCLGCKNYTMLEPTLLNNEWVKLVLQTQQDQRVRCPGCSRSEYTIFNSMLKCRWCRREMLLNPILKGSWILLEHPPLARKSSAKEVAKHLSRSSIYRAIKKLKSTP